MAKLINNSQGVNCCPTPSGITDTTADYDISTREGKDQSLGFRFKDQDGNIMPLVNIDRILFTARFGYKGTLALQLECVIDPTNTIFYIPFTADNTRDLGGTSGCATYKYDIEFEYTGNEIIQYLQGNWFVYTDVPTVQV